MNDLRFTDPICPLPIPQLMVFANRATPGHNKYKLGIFSCLANLLL